MSSRNPREPNSYYFKNFKTPDFKAFLVNFKFFLPGFSNFHQARCENFKLNTLKWREMKNMVLAKFPPGKFPPGKFPPIKLPTGNSTPTPPRKILTQKIPIRNISTDFINCLSSLNTSFGQFFTNLKIRKTKI